MLNFFNKKNKVTDISWLSVDMHSHILPAIDDGAQDVASGLQFVKALENLGFNKLICTPHIYKDLYPNTKETIATAQQQLQKAMDKDGVQLTLGAAAEYMLDQDFGKDDDLCTIEGKYLLVEMSYLNESPNISQTLFDIQIKGVQPILAHPERYTFYFKDKSRLKRFKEKGCLLQLNLLSILGYYGKEVKLLAEALLKENLYDFAGTDLHHEKHLATLTEAVQSGRLFELLGQFQFKNKQLMAVKSLA
ncbi:histidinol phosphatase [Pedobacter polaris]|uniref:protein-tyrosine-phosphatase n=1 Tax=Pedobacter polaris TaxID=2571273 RepID=A0A4U1CWE0_9SPHI|nr:CpsB/CapC family capsule biosynthesis tyrosine phosphatase [Pedobacter polaris]TKC13056.1 histidinol phosphatase [Pedobacter polaris]